MRFQAHDASMTISPSVRPLDHLVLPTAELGTARARLEALGFTVAPDGVHPFGTANCCVYFADGTFLEPLSIRDEELARDEALKGNVFVARDADYRFRRRVEGFSALVFGTGDARADDAAFRAEDLSAGPMLDFSRPVTDAGGKTGTASFRLAFAADIMAPDIFFFTCQRINAPQVDRGTLQRHANGVTRIARVVLSARDPLAHETIVLNAANAARPAIATGEVTRIETSNATVDILGDGRLKAEFGLEGIADRGLHARAIVFGVPDRQAVERRLTARQIAFDSRNDRTVVPAAAGQGAAFAFEEMNR